MKLTVALIAAAALASVSEAKRKPSRYSIERIGEIKDKMQRHYGKDLAGMFDPLTGKYDSKRVGWAHHGKRLGESITQTIGSLSLDASGGTAFWLGATKGLQWEGLPEANQLSNCFAATYSSLETFDLMVHDFATISDTPGKWKGFDVFVTDPLKVLIDNVVIYEMCEFGHILDQFKQMASLDWASLSDNIVREALVFSVEMPETFEVMDQIVEAGKCAATQAKKSAESSVDQADKMVEDEAEAFEEEAGTPTEEDANEKFDSDWNTEANDWDTFAADDGINNADGEDKKEEEKDKSAEPEAEGDFDAEESAKQAQEGALECVSLVNQYEVGQLSGKLFAHFFNNVIQPT